MSPEMCPLPLSVSSLGLAILGARLKLIGIVQLPAQGQASFRRSTITSMLRQLPGTPPVSRTI
jgi:hypothetical protein